MPDHIDFMPYGPYEVPVLDGEVNKNELDTFWACLDAEHPGLKDAVGCYIFAITFRNSACPWYVGKTERASFKKEAFQLHKLEHYRQILKTRKRGTAQIYLIARMTKTGKLRRGKGRLSSIAKLEELLIGVCLSNNKMLVNKSTTKYLREIRVPGYMNETKGARSAAAKNSASLLGS